MFVKSSALILFGSLLVLMIGGMSFVQAEECEKYQRDDGKIICVYESTAQKLMERGWKIIKIDDVLENHVELTNTTPNKLFLSDVENALQITNEEKSQNSGYSPNHLSNYPTTLIVPSQVELNQPFEVKYTWQFLEIEIDEDDPTDIDIERASEQDWFTDRYTKPLTLKVGIPAKVEFVNYQELGYIVTGENVHPNNLKHSISYAKEFDFDDTEIQEETITLKFRSMPSENVLEGFGMGITWLEGNGVGVISKDNDIISLKSWSDLPVQYVIPSSDYIDGTAQRAECDEKCQYFIDNTRDHVKYQHQIMFKYLENNTLTFETGATRENYNNYLYHNTNATFKDFLQSEMSQINSPMMMNDFPTDGLDNDNFINQIDSIVLQFEKEKLERQENRYTLPENVEGIAEMLKSMMESGVPLEDIHQEIIPTYNFSDSFLEELFEIHPDLALQSTEINTQSFFPSLNWILPLVYGQTSSTVTVYGNVYDDDQNNYLSDIKVCIYDTYSNSLYQLLTKEDGSDACVYASGSFGSFTITDILSTDPNGDGTSADYLAVIFFENEDKVKIMDWKQGLAVRQYDTTNIKNNAGYSGYIGAGRIDVSEDDTQFFTLYNTLSDIYDTGASYKSGLDKVHFYYSTDDQCKQNGYGMYEDDQYDNFGTIDLYTCPDENANKYVMGSAQGESRIYLDYRLFDAVPVISHEYGHFIHDEIGESKSGSLDDPYNCGLERFQEGISQCNAHVINEAFAEYFSLVHANSGTIDFRTIDESLGSIDFDYNYLDYENREFQTALGTTFGFDVYSTTTLPSRADVTSAFWDIADSNNDSDPSDVDKKDDLSYGHGEVIREIDTFDSIYSYQDNWETSNDSLDYVFYLNEVDKTFQGDGPLVPGIDSFYDDFENDNLDLWVLSGDDDWIINYAEVNHPTEPSRNLVGTSNNCDDYCELTIATGVNLSKFDYGVLLFDKYVDSGVDGSEGLYVYISEDGGNTWEILKTINGDEAVYTDDSNDDTNEWTSESYNLANYINSDNFKVRFVGDSSHSSELVEIDNVEIIGTNDSGGAGNNAPSVTINSPNTNSQYDYGTYITLSASATDDRDSLTVNWNSNRDGFLGTGSTLSTSSLSVNVHTISASVTDNGNLSGSDSITIIINALADTTAPRIDTINRQDPITATTTESNLTFRVTFDEDVTGVDSTDFETGGTATSSVTGFTKIINTQYNVDVTVTADGTVSLGLKSSGHGIFDTAAAPNALTNISPLNTAQTYSVTLPITSVDIPSSTGSGTVTIRTSSGTLSNVSSVDELTLPTNGKPFVSFPHGLFSLDITGLNNGETATVSITLPSDVQADSQFWKIINNNWIDATSALGSNDGDDTIILTLTDGGIFDADGLVNGQISDPGGVAITETIAPVITLNEDSLITLEAGIDTYTEFGAVVIDNDPNYSGTVTIGGDIVDINIIATYIVTYDAPPDAAGNTPTQVTRTVIVSDNIAPVITAPPVFILEAALMDWITLTQADYGTATATDNIDDPSQITITESCEDCFNPYISGEHDSVFKGGETLVWTAIDSSGNIATTTQDIIIIDPVRVSVGATSAPLLYCGEIPTFYDNIIVGTDSSDYLMGTDGKDLIFGEGGNDLIDGLGKADCIYAGDGNDFIQTGMGNDVIYGGNGDDTIRTSAGDNTVFGEEGNDILYVTHKKGSNVLDGGNGLDVCTVKFENTTASITNCEITE